MAGGYEVAFVQREACGSDIVTVRFEKPEGYSFVAGQWMTLRLETEDGPVTKTFTHCSAPSDPYLEITTRLSDSPYKHALAALTPGDVVHVNGPGGRLTLGPADTRLAFLAGGVGITPVRSTLRQAKVDGRSFVDVLLLYGNRDETCVPFLEEFEEMADMGVRTIVVYEQPPRLWTGERGFITAETVRRHVDPDDGRPFVVTGPPVMVEVMERVLDELEIPAERRRIERFSA